jgi:hypothetical protein
MNDSACTGQKDCLEQAINACFAAQGGLINCVRTLMQINIDSNAKTWWSSRARY